MICSRFYSKMVAGCNDRDREAGEIHPALLAEGACLLQKHSFPSPRGERTAPGLKDFYSQRRPKVLLMVQFSKRLPFLGAVV